MSTSPQPYPYPFGRQWQISIATQISPPPGFVGPVSPNADTAGPTYIVNSAGATPLRVTFNIDTQAVVTAYWLAEICIYNLSTSTVTGITAGAGSPDIASLWSMNKPIVAGDTVNVSAGYGPSSGLLFNPSSNLIYTGKVFQPIWTRENVTDYKLTLRCVSQLMQDALNSVNVPMDAGHTDASTIKTVCEKAGIQIDPTSDQSALDLLAQKTYPRGEALSGKPLTIIDQIIRGNRLTSWLGPNGLCVRLFDPNNPIKVPDFAYGPPNLPGDYAPAGVTTGSIKKTLIGTPEQTQNGIRFRVLLDPTISIGGIVQLAPGALPTAFAYTYESDRPNVPNQPGVYVVHGLRHYGDSRGRQDDWYTEITGVTMNFFASYFNPSQAGGN